MHSLPPHSLPPDDPPTSVERTLESLLDPLWRRAFPVREAVADGAASESLRQQEHPGCVVRALAPPIPRSTDA